MDYAHQKPKYFPVILFQWKEKEKVAFNTSQQIHYISLSTEFHHISKQPHKKKTLRREQEPKDLDSLDRENWKTTWNTGSSKWADGNRILNLEAHVINIETEIAVVS